MGYDLTPSVNLLKALRAERVNYSLLIGEGVDNAFDAGARTVKIEMSPELVAFTDDGIGVTKDRLRAIFSIGDHAGMTTTRLGRFGVGIKWQAISAGDLFSVKSLSVDGNLSAQVDWRAILRSGKWEMDEPRWRPSIVGASTGTTITIEALQNPPRDITKKIADDISLRFHPALVSGHKIFLNDERIGILDDPHMTEVIDVGIGLSGDRTARIHAGILVGPSKLHSVHVAYQHRVIMPSKTIGCGSYGGLTKMFARVQIDGRWKLSKFKDELTNEYERDELDGALLDVLRPILEKCNSASMSAWIDQVVTDLNDRIPPELAASRPHKRKKVGDTDQSDKKSNSGMVKPEKSDPGGPARTNRPPKSRLLITLDDNVAEEHGIGYFISGKPHRVSLSKDHPYISMLLTRRDRLDDQESAKETLYVIAMMIFVEGLESGTTEPEFEFLPFGRRIAKLLAMQKIGEVKEA